MLNNKKEPAKAGLRKAKGGDEGSPGAGTERSLGRGCKGGQHGGNMVSRRESRGGGGSDGRDYSMLGMEAGGIQNSF